MEFKLFDLGLIDFQLSWDRQKNIFLQIKKGELLSALILCQHRPVITLGRSGHKENILAEKEQLEGLNIRIYEIERGGDVTYHGPGQLCIYPIINLKYFKKDINWFLRSLETLLLEVLSEFGIQAQALVGSTGIWVGEEKIASIGIAIKSWITFHGMSLNIKRDDLTNFSLLRPCGKDIIITSMESVVGAEVSIEEVKEVLVKNFKKTYFF
jgi:lipoate-protein ligase B